jgi:N-acetylneuraminic acid mutarotase
MQGWTTTTGLFVVLSLGALGCGGDDGGSGGDPGSTGNNSATSNSTNGPGGAPSTTAGNSAGDVTTGSGTATTAATSDASTATNTNTSTSSAAGGTTSTGSASTETTSTSAGGTGGTIDGDDPAPGDYGERAPLPEQNSEMAVAEAGGLIYVLGGYPSSRETQTTVQVYDPTTDTWDLAAPLPAAIHHPVAVGVDGLLYSLGGQTDAGDIDRTLVYDPSLNVWADLAPMPTARGAGTGAVIENRIYVVGGRPDAQNEFEVYDIGEDAWDELPPLPLEFNQRNHLAAAAIDGKIYVAGGRYNGGSFSSPMTDSLDIFDPASNAWTQGQPMPRARGGNNGVAAYGCFYTWGGEGANTGEPNNVFPDHDVYDPTTDQWTPLAPLPTPVHGVTGAVFLNGLIYMPGGGLAQGGSSGSNIFQVYRPELRCD